MKPKFLINLIYLFHTLVFAMPFDLLQFRIYLFLQHFAIHLGLIDLLFLIFDSFLLVKILNHSLTFRCYFFVHLFVKLICYFLFRIFFFQLNFIHFLFQFLLAFQSVHCTIILIALFHQFIILIVFITSLFLIT